MQKTEKFEVRSSNGERRRRMTPFLSSSFELRTSHFEPQMKRAPELWGAPSAFCFPTSDLSYVACFVRPDAGCHLIFQEELALLQRFLFDFFFDRYLRLRRQLCEARFTHVMLLEPAAKFVILSAENPLNVFDPMRHPFSSFGNPCINRF